MTNETDVSALQEMAHHVHQEAHKKAMEKAKKNIKAATTVGDDKAVEEESLEELFARLSANGADYLRQLGGMISNALETIDSYVAEGEKDEEGTVEPKAISTDAEVQSKTKHDSDEQDEWTVLRKEDTPAVAEATSTTATTTASSQTKQTRAMKTTRDNISAGLETLQKLGYTNEGGWLKQLLVAQNGDVAKVLACLQPAKKQE